jgi:hypothetical protein
VDAVSDAAHAVEQRRITRLAFRAAFLIQFAVPSAGADAGERAALDHLLRVPEVLRELHRRLPHSEDAAPEIHAAHAGIQTLGEALERVRAEAEGGRAPSGLDRMEDTALEILTAVSPPPHVRRTLEAEVAAAVRAYRGRLEQLAAARNAVRDAVPQHGLAGPLPS